MPTPTTRFICCLGFALALCIVFAMPQQAQAKRAHKDLDGRCVEGNCMNGRGKVYMDGGTVYIGHFKKGRRDGYGLRITAEGNRYDEIWKNGKRLSQTFRGGEQAQRKYEHSYDARIGGMVYNRANKPGPYHFGGTVGR